MKLAITGTPGTGKTVVAKQLSLALKCQSVNEKEFALENGLGKFDVQSNELVIDVKKLEKALNKWLEKQKKVIIEGHLLCETKLGVDFVVLLRVEPEMLEERLIRRSYSEEKVQDNVFAEGIDYCKKHVYRNYPPGKIIELFSQKTIKDTTDIILSELKKRTKK